jgi:predicted phosphodiesterase
MKLGLLSDAHGNLEAFELGCQVLRRFGADEICFLGDAVGYLPGPAVVESILASGIDAVRGNHEAMLLRDDPCADEDIYQWKVTAAAMPADARAAIARWPIKRERRLAGRLAILLHGSPADPTFGYVYPDTDLSQFVDVLGLGDAIVFMGNTHRPFIRHASTTTFVNVGSCGLPRDVGALGAACIFDESTGSARILRYDIRNATARALDRCGPIRDVVAQVFTRTTGSYVGELVS